MNDRNRRRRLAITVDVEWDPRASGGGTAGIDEGLPRIVDAVRDRGLPATFFVLGDVCERRPADIRALVSNGFELGSHSHTHDSLHLHTKSWTEAQLTASTTAVERATGLRPVLFRAPGFSITGAALRVLDELGYRLDSSVLPNADFRRIHGIVRVASHRGAPTEPYHPSARDPAKPGALRILEMPVTENPARPGLCIGSWFLHSAGLGRTLKALREAASERAVFLLHPWEHADLSVGHAPIPSWLAASCSADPGPFRAFLDAAADEWDIVSLSELAADGT